MESSGGLGSVRTVLCCGLQALTAFSLKALRGQAGMQGEGGNPGL